MTRTLTQDHGVVLHSESRNLQRNIVILSNGSKEMSLLSFLSSVQTRVCCVLRGPCRRYWFWHDFLVCRCEGVFLFSLLRPPSASSLVVTAGGREGEEGARAWRWGWVRSGPVVGRSTLISDERERERELQKPPRLSLEPCLGSGAGRWSYWRRRSNDGEATICGRGRREI